MPYNYYPVTKYQDILTTDILKRFKFSDQFLKSSLVENYRVQEEDTPESLAYLLYNNTKLSWLILMVNSMSDRNNDWPYSYRNMERIIQNKYAGTSIFFQDEDIDFVMSDASYVVFDGDEYQIKSVDRTFNKITLLESNFLISSGQSIDVYDSSNNKIGSPEMGRIVYDDRFSVHHFEQNGLYMDPREYNVEAESTVLRQYVEGFAEQYVVSNSDNELKLNDQKRDILLIIPEQVPTILNFIQRVFESSNKNKNIIDIEDLD